MEERRSFLNPAEILRHRRRPLYFLLIKSKPVRTKKDFRPAQPQTDVRPSRLRNAVKAAEECMESTARSLPFTFPASASLTIPLMVQGERVEDGFLYLFLHRLDAEFFLDQREGQNRSACNGMKFFIQDALGDTRFE